MAQPAKLILVDAHSLIFQVFHAFRQPMSSPDGRPTAAVYGFTRDIFTLRDLNPDYLVFAFDLPGPVFRNEIEPQYKAHRAPPPDDLQIQFPMIQQVVKAFNAPVVAVKNYEADDVIATLTRAGQQRGFDVIICSTDKDCRQLLSDNVRMYNMRKQIYLDPEALRADWGVSPEQVIDYQAMVGDSVDNVKGVPGVSAKTATKLLQEFGSLDNLLKNADQVKPERISKALKENVDAVALSKQLVTLKTDVPIEMDWDAWKLQPFDAPKLQKLFEEFGFRGFANRVRTEATASAAPPADLYAGHESDEAFPFGANAPQATNWQAEYHLVDSEAKLKKLVAELRKQTRFAFDVETTGLDPLRSDLVGLALAWKTGEAFYIAVRGPEECAKLSETAVLSALKPLFANAEIAKINQNIKYDWLHLRHLGVDVNGVAGDSMIADYLLRAGERSHGLDELARKQLGHENIHIEELIGKRGKNQLTMDQVPTDKVCAYAAEDADVAWRLTEMLEAELTETSPQLRKLYDTIEIPLISVLAEMEFSGIRLDVPYLQQLSKEMESQLASLEKEIHQIAGSEFNIASPLQLRKVLFEDLQLPVQKKTKLSDASSTDQETLERLAALHPLPKKIVEYRQVAKLKGTYVDALPALVNPSTERLHTSFNQAVAATGRLSSTDPNLQNIPARTDQGQQIRKAFIPADGWQLLTADYSQIELRLLAHCSGDENLKQAFVDRQDIHASVAAKIFGVAPDKVNKEQRRVAKTVNFGVIYGMSPHGLAIRLGMDRDVAAKFIDDYFAGFPGVQSYQADVLARCASAGYVESLLGRRRRIAGVRARASYKSLNQPEREAINMEIQGSAADMMKLAMLAVHRQLVGMKMKSRMLLTVHDELVFEAPAKEVNALAAMVRTEMANAMPLAVPIEVDVAVGPTWLDVEEIEA